MRFRSLLAVPLLVLAFDLANSSFGQGPNASTSAESLKYAVDGRFKIGVGVSERILSDPKCSELIRKHFEILTPENCMEPQGIHPAEDRWKFDAPDRFVAFAKKNDLELADGEDGYLRESVYSTTAGIDFNVLGRSEPGHANSDYAAHERTDWMSQATHKQLLMKAKQGKIDVYFQGDSITRRWGATDYPKLLQHREESVHGWNAANFAWGGDNTHNILSRMQNGELEGLSPKVIVLQAGTDNLSWEGAANQETINDVVDGIEAIIEEFQQRVPDAAMVLTGLFPRDQNTALTPAIKEINVRLRALVNERRIRFLNINAQLTDAEGRFLSGYSRDGLHLEQPAYEVWAAALRPVFQEILGPPAATDKAPSPTRVPMKTDP